MKRLLSISFIVLTNISVAQTSIDEYSFIEVPDRFEFLSGDNPHQLSDMMVFYLKKNKLKAFRESDIPNIAKCDMLYADIIKKKSLLTTKLSVVILDCNNSVLYESPTGSSRIKTYDKAYQDALRDAFNFFDKERINISETNIPAVVTTSTNQNATISTDDVLKTEPKTINTPIPKETKVEEVKTSKNIPKSSFSNYSLNGQSYLLKKVATGFTLFLTQEGKDAFVKIGDIVLKDDATFLMKDIYGETKKGYFNGKQDVVILLSSGKEIVYNKTL